MPPSPLLAFGFESLPMLGWLAAAPLPWLIHLLSRRKHRETAWAAMDFLLAAVKRRTRRVRIEQWLLLAVRTLVIVALVLAVADPYVQRAPPVFSPNGSTHHVLVIDCSYSMAYASGDGSRFDRAKRWAARIVDQSPPGDGFTLVQMAAPPRTIVATPGMEAGPIRQEIQNLELLHTGADLAATLSEVRKVLDTARRDSPRLTRHEVCFFSDLQRGTWMPAMSDAAKAEFHRRAAELAGVADLQVVNLGHPGDDNLAVTSLDLRDARVLVGRSVAIDAGVRDFGSVARKRQAVDLMVDGRQVARQYLDVPAGGSAVVRFEHRFQTGGDHAVEARLAGDPLRSSEPRGPADALEIDNHRYLSLHVRTELRVLCVDGRPQSDLRRSSVFYLDQALSSRSDPQSDSPIEVEVAPQSAVLERDLDRYDCVMLSNVGLFTVSEGRAFEKYLARGGSLVFFLGDQVKADNYNRVLAGMPGEPPQILPARLLSEEKNPGGRLDPLEYRHPIVQKFRGNDKAGLLDSPVERYFRVAPSESAAGRKEQVVLALGNGDPLIVAQPVRRGRVVLVTTSADVSWSLLPLCPTFDPLVKEILDWCTAGQSRPRNLEVGDPLEATVTAPGLSEVTVERPGGQRKAVPVQAEGDYSTWRYDDTPISGIYTAHYPSPSLPQQVFAVNLATAESDLTAISQDELESEVWPGVAVDYGTSLPAEGSPLLVPSGKTWQLPVALCYAAIALLLLETILAWKFGYNVR